MKKLQSNPFLATKSRPIVVGHRGVPARHQENTIAGFRYAASIGIDAVELDVRVTKDGRAVVCHDNNLERLTGKTELLASLTWDKLSALRIRRCLPMGIDVAGRPVVAKYDKEESIPLLAEVFAEIGPNLCINVELKMDGPIWHTRIGDIVAKEIAKANLQDRVIVTSFDLRKLRATQRRDPQIAVGFCFDDSMLDFFNPVFSRRQTTKLLRRALSTQLTSRFLQAPLVGADHTLLQAEVVDGLHDKGIAVGTYTLFPIGSTTGKAIDYRASQDAEVLRLANMGVDWIESDDPERLQECLAKQ